MKIQLTLLTIGVCRLWCLTSSAATPDDAAIQAGMQVVDAEIKPGHYDVVRVDLDGDGTDDVLALMNGKSGYCGSGGCTLFVFKAGANGLTKVGAVKIVSRPIYLRKITHHGFRDLLVSVRGGGASPGFAALEFDGSSYPVSPGEGKVEKQDDDAMLFGDDAAGFKAIQELQGITFRVTSTANQVTITPSGLEIDNSPVSAELKGIVKNVEVGDINVDGSPEIYVFTAETTGDQRASLIAYSANKKKSLSAIYLPPLEDDTKNAKGYRGHDDMAVVEGVIARRFPIYPADVTITKPTGKTRQLQYKLKAGEAGWVMKLDRVVEY